MSAQVVLVPVTVTDRKGKTTDGLKEKISDQVFVAKRMAGFDDRFFRCERLPTWK